MTERPDIQVLTPESLASRLAASGQPAYRVEQVLEWVHRHLARSWEELTNVPRLVRERLAGELAWFQPELVRRQGSADATQKFLWRLRDGALIESVLIPANPALYGERSDRLTLCVSTQVGCAYGCRFCASGLEGWKRNLGAEEIVAQVLAVERLCRAERGGRTETAAGPSAGAGEGGRFISNLVIMGMGEPLANYAALLQALGVLNAPWGLSIGARKITVSTSGLVPQIRRLAEQPLQFGLAISLHGATDAVRNRIMPVNRKYPLKALLDACEEYVRRKGRMITLEYILISGVNDDVREVAALAAIARRLGAKVNLIPYNQVEGLPWRRPSESVQERFRAGLEAAGIGVTLRREKGHDIEAACGQLRLRTERELAQVGGGGAPVSKESS